MFNRPPTSFFILYAVTAAVLMFVPHGVQVLGGMAALLFGALAITGMIDSTRKATEAK